MKELEFRVVKKKGYKPSAKYKFEFERRPHYDVKLWRKVMFTSDDKHFAEKIAAAFNKLPEKRRLKLLK